MIASCKRCDATEEITEGVKPEKFYQKPSGYIYKECIVCYNRVRNIKKQAKRKLRRKCDTEQDGFEMFRMGKKYMWSTKI